MCIEWPDRGFVSRDMQDELRTFLEAPTAGNYRVVRELLLDEWSEHCSSTALLELAELAAAGQFAAVLEQVETLQPHWALSPRVHFLAAVAAEELEDPELAELEKFVFQACLEGILATGDGSADSPYLITYLSDEYDVLAALGLSPRSQSLVERGDMLCDVVKCDEGEQVWFELSGLIRDPRHCQAEFAVLQSMRR